MKITFLGAGSSVFAKNVLGDCLLAEGLPEFEIALLDIDGAEKDLIDSLQADPNFEKSKKMLEGFKNAENKFENDKN